METMVERTIGQDAGGTFAEWYDEERGLFTRWYGPVGSLPQDAPAGCEWWPVEWADRPDPFDLACERRWD